MAEKTLDWLADTINSVLQRLSTLEQRVERLELAGGVSSMRPQEKPAEKPPEKKGPKAEPKAKLKPSKKLKKVKKPAKKILPSKGFPRVNER